MSRHAFSDLIGDPAPRKRPRDRVDLMPLLAKAVAACEAGAIHEPRPRLCGRCVKLADKARDAGEFVPPIAEVESWVDMGGHVYFAGTCRDCTDLEWSEFWQRLHDRAAAKKNHGEMKRLVDVSYERERAGRKFFAQRPLVPEASA